MSKEMIRQSGPLLSEPAEVETIYYSSYDLSFEKADCTSEENNDFAEIENEFYDDDCLSMKVVTVTKGSDLPWGEMPISYNEHYKGSLY